jgi:hypothetical protein
MGGGVGEARSTAHILFRIAIHADSALILWAKVNSKNKQ